MFCNKCGANLPEGATFCSECGNKISAPEETTMSENAAKPEEMQTTQPQQQTSQQQSSQQQTHSQQVPQQQTSQQQVPGQQAPSQQKPAAEAVPEAEPVILVPEKKKSRKGKWIALAVAAVVLITGTIGGVFAREYIANWINKTFFKDTYLEKTLEKNIKNIFDAGADAESINAYKSGVTAEVMLEKGEAFEDAINDLEKFADIDASEVAETVEWLDNATIKAEVSTDGDNYGLRAQAKINDTEIIKAEGLVDTKAGEVYLNVPDVFKTALAAKLPEEVTNSMVKSVQLSEDLAGALPEKDKLEEIIIRYMNKAVGTLDSVQIGEEDVFVGSLEKKYTTISVTANDYDVCDFAIAFFEELENDSEIRNIAKSMAKTFLDYQKAAGYDDGYDIDEVMSEYDDGIENIIKELKDTKDNIDPDYTHSGNVKLYVDGKGDIKGFEISIDGNKIFHYKSIQKFTKLAVSMYIPEVMEISGEGKAEKSKFNMTLNVKLGKQNVATIEISDVNVKKLLKDNLFEGTITVSLTNSVSEMLSKQDKAAGEFAKNTKIKLIINQQSLTEVSKKLQIVYKGKLALGMNISTKAGAAKIQKPGKYEKISLDNFDEEDLLENCKFDKVLNNLKKAGLPKMYSKMLEVAIKKLG